MSAHDSGAPFRDAAPKRTETVSHRLDMEQIHCDNHDKGQRLDTLRAVSLMMAQERTCVRGNSSIDTVAK
jgi:hypothetical protein